MMQKTPEKAFGSHYFTSGTPIAVAEVNPSPHAQHPHDLTGIEHYHDFCELVLVTAGSTIHCIDGEEYPVSAGDLFLIQGHGLAPRRKALVIFPRQNHLLDGEPVIRLSFEKVERTIDDRQPLRQILAIILEVKDIVMEGADNVDR